MRCVECGLLLSEAEEAAGFLCAYCERQATETISPGMQKWLQREARVCGMSTDAIIAAALAEYRARRTPEDRLRFRDGTPNYHHRNVKFIEDEDAGR